MAIAADKQDKQNNSDSFEQKLWKTADKLRKNNEFGFAGD